MRSLSLLAVLAGTLLPLGAEAQAPAGLSDWQPSRTPGVDVMPLIGSPRSQGSVVYRIRAASGVQVGPHSHTQTMHLTVLSGTLMLATGERPDSGQALAYARGSFLDLPAGTRHLEWFEGETVVHVETAGPLETVFVDARDDPRNQAPQ